MRWGRYLLAQAALLQRCGVVAAEEAGDASCDAPGLSPADVAFSEWLTSRGVDAPNVRVKDFGPSGFGRGVEATEDVSEGDVLMRVPLEAVVSRGALYAAGGGAKMVSEAFGASNPDVMMAAFLVMEQAKGDASTWKAYLDVLPAQVSSAWLFSEAALEALCDPALAESLATHKARLVSEFEQVAQPLIVKALATDGVNVDASEVRLEDFLRGVALSESRALTISGTKYLVPFADMFNYHHHPSPRQSTNGDFFLKHHVLNENFFEVRADRDAKSGTQVFMDYGDNPSAIYLRHHGFVPDINPFDCVELTGRVPKDKGVDFFARREVLREQLGFPPVAVDCFQWSTVTTVWPRSYVNGFERINSLSDEDVDDCLQQFSKAVGTSEHQRISQTCMSKSSISKESLQGVFQQHLDQLVALSLKLHPVSADTAEDVKLATQYRESRIKILKQLLAYVGNDVIPPSVYGIPSIEELSKQVQQLGLETKEVRAAALSQSVAIKAEKLNEWVQNSNFPVVRIKAVEIPGFRLGTVATDDLAPETPYVVVPKWASMDTSTATKSMIYPALHHLGHNLGRPDSFHELLLFLMFEYFVQGTRSDWWPYLMSLPTLEEMESPSYYSDEELQELTGHHVKSEAIDNAATIRRKYSAVRGFLYEKIGQVILPPSVFTEDNYMWAHSILDSRAIWWDGERHLVPLLDMVNCKSTPGRVHSTEYSSVDGGAITRTAAKYVRGEQVFEEYGQPNYIYFMFHGFSLEDNSKNCVKVKMKLTEKQQQNLSTFHFQKPSHPSIKNIVDFCVKSPLSNNHDVKATFKSFDPIVSALQDVLAKMPTSLTDDLDRLKTLPAGKKRNALQFIINEKRFIQDILESQE